MICMPFEAQLDLDLHPLSMCEWSASVVYLVNKAEGTAFSMSYRKSSLLNVLSIWYWLLFQLSAVYLR